MKNKIDKKVIRIRAALVFLTMFVIILGCTFLVNENQKKREQLKAAYTAESTISRVEVQLNRYMAESDLVKKSIEDGLMISDAQFAQLFRLMQDEDYIIKAHEIAKDGIVSQIYPIQGNENAMGFNVLEDSERKKAALLARDSGEYTIAGPFDLVQGGTGVLLFDPVYQTDAQGNEKFWGFSILVMDWEKFIDKMELDKLEDAGYHYQIWKRDNKDNEKVVIAQCVNFEKEDILEVACEVPNDTWYFEIIPENGWITLIQRLWGLLISFMSSFIIMIVYLQFRMRRYREKIHETELEKAVHEAKCANEAKTRFLFNMSHDIRTPINAIIGFADLLEKHIDEKERVRDYIGKIKSSSEFLLSLINYVLETARIESGKTSLKKEVCCASRLIESLTDIFEPEVCKKGLTYSYTKDIEHEYVMGDETKVREIFINIIGNSLKYTPAGGKITIDIREIPFDRENYIAYKIVVEDTGIGMSEDYLPHIFEEFSREHTSTESKVVGTGLGLPIVKALISLMTAFIIMIVYLQFRMQRYREQIHETELEKAVYEAKSANEAKTRFLFNMSHDIRTPMNAIIGFAELLEKHIDERDRALDYIGKIKSSSEFLLSLINYVLETARIESGKTTLKKEVCCASRLIESLTDIFEPEVCKKGLTYSYTKDIEHEYVMGDETKVREIFINIIGNSLKYTPAGGKITIDIREIPFDRENYIAYKIVVEDTGIGMSEDYLPHIFEEFSREHTSTESKVVGTGLGLPIVKALIDLMGGTIEIESEVGKGTKTTVMIPFEIATQEQILEEQQKEKEFVPEDIKGKRILVAEDNELNAEITLTVLKEKGLLVERAANGKECVEMLKEKPADYYDMILMDIQMPEMDGYQATEMIRNLGDSRAAVPIVAMTANAFEEDRQKALDAGMNAHVSKPVDMNVLFRVMAKFI